MGHCIVNFAASEIRRFCSFQPLGQWDLNVKMVLFSIVVFKNNKVPTGLNDIHKKMSIFKHAVISALILGKYVLNRQGTHLKLAINSI